MNKYVLGIDGMKCGMCETHVADIIRRNFKYKKVKASHLSKNVTIISPEDISFDEFKRVFSQTGYKVLSYDKGVAVKKLFFWR